ncbi:MAG TPA: deaminase [Candidatus Saccharimonadales bacterium]|nr:deaminase [Candidatus Saccharimonadales bacterium]
MSPKPTPPAKIKYAFDWAELAFASKKPVRSLKAIFIAAPRELSNERFKQLIKEYLPQGNIVLGIAKEEYIDGFEGQPQFRTLQLKDVQGIVDTINKRKAIRHRIYTLDYFQRELPFLIDELNFSSVVLIRGSWQYMFHTSPAYYRLMQRKITYAMVSPFTDEVEARAYAKKIDLIYERWEIDYFHQDGYSEKGMFELAATAAKLSFDYNFQTGLAIGRKMRRPTDADEQRYEALGVTYNEVVPFSTYAMHYGNVRETHLSPPNDLNYYDTNHAEVDLIVGALKHKLDLAGTILFINLLPCPTCARMLSKTDIEEVIYTVDHSDGYAIKMLEAAGKKVRRVVL